MNKTILNYGLVSGGVAALLMLIMALYMQRSPDNFEHGEIFGYSGIMLSMVFVFLGVRAYRDQVSDGVISFGKAFQVGLIIMLISCVIYVIAWMIISNTLMTDFMEKYVAFVLKQLEESGASAEAISAKTAEMEHFSELYKNPLIAAGLTFLEPLPIGLPVTLISAAVLRRS
ncbi:MAG: DUF4199 domain-containing protein [Bacteroidetes bacterium]|nr:MAG: DUF4199 domain-containing protein [Bacteroidota bacterium]